MQYFSEIWCTELPFQNDCVKCALVVGTAKLFVDCSWMDVRVYACCLKKEEERVVILLVLTVWNYAC